MLDVKELLPGDPRLPATTYDGSPWPRQAGALWARALINTATDDGRAALASAKFFGAAESAWSIGYRAVRARQAGTTRHLDEVDLFEIGPVLHPANRHARLLSVKGFPVTGVEVKMTVLRAGGPSSRPGRARLSARELAEAREIRASKAFREALGDELLHVTDPGRPRAAGDVCPVSGAGGGAGRRAVRGEPGLLL